jgi:hypothetical protein
MTAFPMLIRYADSDDNCVVFDADEIRRGINYTIIATRQDLKDAADELENG